MPTTDTGSAKLRKMPLEVLTEVGGHVHTTDASILHRGLGWPGFPGAFTCPDLGNGQVFVRDKIDRDAEGELFGVWYTQRMGCVRVLIVNT